MLILYFKNIKTIIDFLLWALGREIFNLTCASHHTDDFIFIVPPGGLMLKLCLRFNCDYCLQVIITAQPLQSV